MTEVRIEAALVRTSDHPRLQRIRKAVLRPMFCSVLASIGIFGGLSSLVAGLLCVLIHAFIARDRVFDQVGTVLLIVAIPMILIGSVFLDEIQGNRC
ncbi:MAG TPA: hypothetical protein VGO43_03120 [Pyrinomonadaceae bacterium]|jgi:hypothetical protein|nr:hypothetical protein [Pyrinomonadaceae bacterium]